MVSFVLACLGHVRHVPGMCPVPCIRLFWVRGWMGSGQRGFVCFGLLGACAPCARYVRGGFVVPVQLVEILWNLGVGVVPCKV